MSLLESPPSDEAKASTDGDARDKPGSLLPVIRIIPAEAYENPTWKGMLYFARDMAIYIAAVVGLFLFDNIFISAGLMLIAVMSVAALFILGHDTAHQALFKSRKLNDLVGHIVMLPSWHVYEGWVLGHNRIHHKYTVRQGFDFVWHPYTTEQWAEMSGYEKARHRLEWSWLGAGFYYGREVWWHKMMVGKPPARSAKIIRRDRWIVTAFIAGTILPTIAAGYVRYDGNVLNALVLAGKMWVVPCLGFFYVVGSFVHVHHIQPTIRWWSRREWTKFKGQMEGTTVLRMVPGANFFFHWIMVHIPHHVDVRIPMYNLELAADAIRENFPETVHDEKLRFRDFISNTQKCKLYDFEEGHWLTYGEADQRIAEGKIEATPTPVTA